MIKIFLNNTAALLLFSVFSQTSTAAVQTISGRVTGDILVDTTFDFAGYDYRLSFTILPDGGGQPRGCNMWADKEGDGADRISFVMSGLMAARLTGAHVTVYCDDWKNTASIALD